MKRIIAIITLLFCIEGYMVDRVNAHYAQTHQYITGLALEVVINANEQLENDDYTQYINFLKTVINEDGTTKTYQRKLMEGLRDADKRVNGLFAFGKEWNDCWDWNLNPNCSQGETYLVSNDIEHWPVGDHGYNPDTKTGFNSLIKLNEIDEYISEISGINNAFEYNQLLEAISNLYPNDDPIEKLKFLLQTSNAADMANHFYQIAIAKWEENDRSAAMYNLGIALHAIQDMTVPHHTRLLGDEEPENWNSTETFFRHDKYEEITWVTTLDNGNRSYNDFLGDPPSLEWDSSYGAKEWAVATAEKSYNPSIISLDPNEDGMKGLKLGAYSTLWTMKSFFNAVNFTGSNNDFYLLSGTASAHNNPVQYYYVYASETTGANLGNNVYTTDGTYQMALFTGNYNVYALAYIYPDEGGYIQLRSDFQNITMDAGRTLDIDFPVPQFYHIRGRVTDSGDSTVGIANVSVYANNQSGLCYTRNKTDADGYYDIPVIPGTYSMTFQPPSDSIYSQKRINNVVVANDVPTMEVSLDSNELFLLSGSLINSIGNSASIYATDVNENRYYNTYTSTGGYEMLMPGGQFRIYSRLYYSYTEGYTYFRSPYQTITFSESRSLDILFPDYQLHRLTGIVTDTLNLIQENVRVYAYDSNSICQGYSYSDRNGKYGLSLIPGEYRITVEAPSATYPPFQIKNILVSKDVERNIRLSLDYSLLDDAINELPPGLEVGLDVFDIIDEAESIDYDISVQGANQLLQIILNWPGSEMRLTVYRPDGSEYGTFQETTPPINVQIEDAAPGLWRCRVTAIEVSQDNYPFAFVAATKPNQPPTADAGGPYAGYAGEEVSIDASGSTDSDGEIVNYEWDWNGDGIFEESTTEPIILHTWEDAYTGSIILKATDSRGEYDTDTAQLDITDLNDIDNDGDGYSENENDCNDNNSSVYPGAEEICGDGIDNNCNDKIDENCSITGDLDGDGDIDRADVNVINSYRNQPASVYPEADIDGDGTITVLDARKLMRMCDCPRCVCQ